jgi:hypothetical protein
MALYFPLDWISSVAWWFYFIIMIITFVFLIIGGLDLKKGDREFESANFLVVIGFILLIGRIVYWFLPRVIRETTFPEFFDTLIYQLIYLGIFDTLNLMLGFAFIKFGGANKDSDGTFIRWAGVLNILAWSIIIIMDIILNLDYWFGFPYFDVNPQLLWTGRFLVPLFLVVSAILILVWAIKINKIFMIIFAAFNLAFFVLYLLLVIDRYSGLGIFAYFPPFLFPRFIY